jgi:hypothetical protein
MTAPTTYTHTNTYKIPRGKVAFSRLRDGGTYEGYRFLGNCPEFNLQVESENYQHQSSEGGLNQIDLDVVISITRTSGMTVDNMSTDNLAIFLGAAATSYTQSVTPITAEEITGFRTERAYKLGEGSTTHPQGVTNVSSVTVTCYAPARANSTAYAVGSIYLPATPNNHLYLCTVAGTSAASPPTFNTAGSTYSDGTATFLDLGVVTSLAVNTDYYLDATHALVSIGTTGKLASAYNAALAVLTDDQFALKLRVDYTPAASVRSKVATGSTAALSGKLVFFADNAYGTNQDVVIPSCTIKPSGTLPFIGANEAASVAMDVGINIRDSSTPAIIVSTRG